MVLWGNSNNLEFVFLEALLATFCLTPDSLIVQVEVRKEEESKRLRLVPTGSWGLQTIWGISGCCLTPEGGRGPSGRGKDFNWETSTCTVSSFSWRREETGLSGRCTWESWVIAIKAFQGLPQVLSGPLSHSCAKKSGPLGVSLDADLRGLYAGDSWKNSRNEMLLFSWHLFNGYS